MPTTTTYRVIDYTTEAEVFSSTDYEEAEAYYQDYVDEGNDAILHDGQGFPLLCSSLY